MIEHIYKLIVLLGIVIVVLFTMGIILLSEGIPYDSLYITGICLIIIGILFVAFFAIIVYQHCTARKKNYVELD